MLVGLVSSHPIFQACTVLTSRGGSVKKCLLRDGLAQGILKGEVSMYRSRSTGLESAV